MAVRPAATRRQSVRRRRQAAFFEALENRQLLAVVNVNDFGARTNDNADDSGAIQKALDASKGGDTIVFSGGTYDLKSTMKNWPSDRTYVGQNNATLRGTTSKGQLISFRGDDITITGLTFEGGGVFIDRGSGFNQNIVIDNNVFKLDTRGENPNGITFSSGLKHAQITNNYFTGYASSFGIYGYNYNDLVIANNEFVNITAGMHIDAFSGSGNLLVEQNYITGAKGMGMEFQSTASNLVFQDNWFENPNLSAEKKRNNNSMAFSLILDKSSNISIRRNVVIAPQRPDGIGCRIAFEVGGDNTIVEDNYVDGINHVLAVNDGVGTCSVVAKNNVFKNYLQGAKISFPSNNPKRTYEQSNNGPNVKLTWDLNRGKPGRNVRLNGTNNAPPAPEVPAPVVVTPPEEPPVVDPPKPATPETPATPESPATPAAGTPPETGGTGDTAPVTQEQTPTKPTTPVIAVERPVEPAKPVIPPPSAPKSLTAKAVTATRVDLRWTDTSTNETGFFIERSLDGVNWGSIGTAKANATRFTVAPLPSGVKFYFRIRAFNSGGLTAYSNTAAVTTPALPTPVVIPSMVAAPPTTETLLSLRGPASR